MSNNGINLFSVTFGIIGGVIALGMLINWFYSSLPVQTKVDWETMLATTQLVELPFNAEKGQAFWIILKPENGSERYYAKKFVHDNTGTVTTMKPIPYQIRVEKSPMTIGSPNVAENLHDFKLEDLEE